MGKSPRNSIESVAAALGDAKDEAWERTFEIAKAKRPKRKGRARKGIAVLAVLGSAGFVLAKKREAATSAAKSAAGKGTAVAKSAADKGKVVGADLKTKAASATETIKAKTGRGGSSS